MRQSREQGGWGGQAGGFLIWMSWMLVLALLFLRRNPGRLEAPVMALHGGVLTGLSSMLLGLYFGDFQFGLDPFLLLREAPQNAGLPWTFNADYLALIPQFADGQGLNPLLQNYWMVIHPPTLFLGFASTLMPFALAVGGPARRRPRGGADAGFGGTPCATPPPHMGQGRLLMHPGLACGISTRPRLPRSCQPEHATHTTSIGGVGGCRFAGT